MAAWSGAVTSETERRLALDTTGEVQRTGAGSHGVAVKEAEEGSARKVPGSGFCKEGSWGCPLRQGTQGAGSQEVRCLCWARVGTDCRNNSLSKGAERRRAKETTRGPVEYAGIFQKVGLWLVLAALTAGREV